MKHYTHQKGDLFNQERLSDFIDKCKQNIRNEINSETDDYILNVSEDSYIDVIKGKYEIIMPEIEYDSLCIDSFEAEVPTKLLPSYSFYGDNDYIKRDIYCLHIPVTGNIKLLHYCPSSFMFSGGGDFYIDNLQLTMEYLTFSDNPEEIKRQFDSSIERLKKMYENLKNDIDSYNSHLLEFIKYEFEKRKSQLLTKNNLLASIGYPLKERADSHGTFSIPSPKLRESIKVQKPVVSERGYQPEPTIDDDVYYKILKIIDDAGKNFERMPSISSGKGEEDLRDYILFLLDPHFENGNATGETFNKTGKTDIQIRYDSSVVFIAECKFWKGEKAYLATIDQLLGYLTWRDTKTSIIIFVKQKDITQVIEKVKNATPKHANYKNIVNQQGENWINYRFHINGDSNRDIKLAVQIFHIP
ncbi:MAG: hypothetical protein DBY04_07825 [Clostridiales bacterium]|jgi:hypothetical protein|nr:MAG: hypothetical protein DBY04_07825 [Clostridiales bacterium]